MVGSGFAILISRLPTCSAQAEHTSSRECKRNGKPKAGQQPALGLKQYVLKNDSHKAADRTQAVCQGYASTNRNKSTWQRAYESSRQKPSPIDTNSIVLIYIPYNSMKCKCLHNIINIIFVAIIENYKFQLSNCQSFRYLQ